MEFVKLVGPAGVFFIMFALGLNLRLKQLIQVFKYPGNFITGIISQSLVLPIIGLITVSLVDMSPELTFGVFLLLIMPSAAMSNYATRLVDGNVSLSICLTSFCALFSFITIPLYLNLFSKEIYELPFDINLFSFSIKTFLFITLPVFIGIFCITKFTRFFQKQTIFLDKLAFVIFIIVVLIGIYQERGNLVGYFDDVGIVVIGLLLVVFITVLIITNIFIEDIESKRAVIIEGLLQNGAMGFVVGTFLFNDVAYLVPIALYALLQYAALLFYIGNIKIKK